MAILTVFGIALFIVIYVLISTEIINKTIAVLLGGTIFILSGIIHQESAFREVDWNVIFLLIGMMVIVGITKKTGLFQFLAIKAAKAVRGNPIMILILLSLITAVISAFLDNVTTVLILAPISILIAVELGVSPIPFVLANAIASNIGGTATLIGDPPNIMIGSAVGLSFMDFLVNLAPVILIILVVFAFMMYLMFGKKLVVSNERRARIMEFDENKLIKDIPLLIKSLVVLAIVIVGFLLHSLLHIEAGTIALFGASLLMVLTVKEDVEEVFKEIEWGTIFFFIGLFILVGGLIELGVIKAMSEAVLQFTGGDIAITSLVMVWVSGFLSAFIDNIPYVATMIPLIKNLGAHLGALAIMPVWWSLSLGACLGGNGTLIGASANVISAGILHKNGYKLSFLEFTRYGFIVMIVSLVISTGYIYVRYLMHL